MVCALHVGLKWLPLLILQSHALCKYSMLWLVQVQNGKITICPSINYWKVQKENNKCLDEADNLKFLKSFK